MKKYELTDETTYWNGVKLHRIRALKNFGKVKRGDLGGFVESESNLSQFGDCWVGDNAVACANSSVFCDAIVCDNAKVCDGANVYHNAKICGYATVCDHAEVYGRAKVFGTAWICERAEVCDDGMVYGSACVGGRAEICGLANVGRNCDYMLFRNTWSSGRWFTYMKSTKKWRVGCFYGSGESLIKKAYADSKMSGRCYEAIVRAVEQIEEAMKK